MTVHQIDFTGRMVITTTEAGEAGIDRYVGLTPDAAKEFGSTPGMTKDEVLAILVCLGVKLGVSDASRLDGFADLGRDDIYLHIDDVEAEL